MGPLIISESTTRPYPRWLGVLFDKKLSFKWHVQEMTSRTLVVANALRSLSNTVRGIPSHLMQQVVNACVLRKLYFAAETWWPGRSRPDHTCTGREPSQVSNRMEGILNKLSKVIIAGARAILPVYVPPHCLCYTVNPGSSLPRQSWTTLQPSPQSASSALTPTILFGSVPMW